jgi:predicted nuclease of predicted toxin-antitoxin system
MRVKLDENLPSRLVPALKKLGHEVDTVPQEGLKGRDDSDVWSAAQKADRFLITQDLDFSDTRKYMPGTHQGVLLVRLREPGRLALTRRVRFLFENQNTEQWKGCLVVATDHKIRVRSK